MTKPLTMGHLFLEQVEKLQNKNAIGDINNSRIDFISFQKYFDTIEVIGLGLESIGLETGDSLAILSHTRKEWHFVDLATICIRGTVIPIYPTYLDEEISYIINHSESKFLLVEDEIQFDKLLSILPQLNNLKVVISIEKIPQEKIEKLSDSIKFYQYNEILDQGNKLISNSPEFLKRKIDEASESDIASIIYTSGTTGEPKGAVITTYAFAKMIHNIKTSLSQHFFPEDRTLTWLPLSHVFGRCDSMLPIAFGWELVFGKSIDTLLDDIGTTKPTIMLAVPRIFEKIYAKISEQIEAGSFLKKSIFSWAQKVSNAYFDKIEKDYSPSASEILQRKLAYKLVYSKIYEKFGGKIRFFVSGGAPLSPEIIKFLRNCNLTVLEGYGLTETIAPVCINSPAKQIPGTVGLPVGDVEFKLADDGELLIKTEAMLKEYYKNPEETAKAIKDGWFYSGDIAEYNSEGYLKITDRKKEIIITAGGKNVAPQKIENMMKTKKHISQFVTIGDRQKYLTAVVGIERDNFKDYEGLKDLSLEELSTNKEAQKLIQEDINSVNKNLAQFETIKRFFIAPEEFTVESGLVTPSLKIKRKVIGERYQSNIDKMYS